MPKGFQRPGYAIFLLLYHIAATLIVVIVLPFLLLVPGRNSRERLGLHFKKKSLFKDTLWVHALSVGEVLSALPLLEAMKARYPERPLIFTVTTRQGILLANEKVPRSVAAVFPMPLDFWWSIHRAVRCINPALFVLVETDIWPGLLSFLLKREVKCILVNGRISPKTFASYKKVSFLMKLMFLPFTRCLMQTDLDRERLVAIGLEEKRVVTGGNIKFDQSWPAMNRDERIRWRERLGIRPEHRVLVAGSTHQGEEAILLRVYSRVIKEVPSLRLLLAPRKIERANEVLELAQQARISSELWSRVDDHDGESFHVVIVDTLGELSRLYGLAEVSFVGGSLVPFGGHNLLEPASFGCPVLFGPHTNNFVEISQGLARMKGGVKVDNEKHLEETILRLLRDSDLRDVMGKRASEFVLANRGALKRVLDEIDQSLNPGGKTDWA